MTTLKLPQWVTLLIEIYYTHRNKRYYQKLHQYAKISSTHARRILKSFEKCRLIIKTKGNKKIKYLDLSKKGTGLAKSFITNKNFYEVLKNKIWKVK